MKKRNNAAEFYRFFFSVIICIFHFKTYSQTDPPPFAGGYLAVEFFLMLSGYFLAKNAFEKAEKGGLRRAAGDSFSYILGRAARLYPHYLFSVLCLAALRILAFGNMTVERWLGEGLGELFMLQTVADRYTLSVVLWFPSALFLACVPVYILARLGRRIAYIAFPVLSVGILGWLMHTNGKLDLTFSHHFLFSDGFWRAAAGLMLGGLCFGAVQLMEGKLKERKTTGAIKIMSTIIEPVLLAVLTVILYSPPALYRDCAAVVLFALFIVLVMSGTSCFASLLDNPVSGYLGKISYAMYFNEIIFYLAIFKYYPAGSGVSFAGMTAIYLVLVILASMLTTLLTEPLSKGLSKLISGGKKKAQQNKQQ